MSDPLTGSKALLVGDFEATPKVLKGTPTPKTFGFVNYKPSGTQNLLKNPTIRPDGNRARPVNGRIAASGSFEKVMTIDEVPWFTRLFLHALATTGAGDPYTHVSKWDLSTATLKTAQFQLFIAASNYVLFKSCRLKKFGLKIADEGFLIGMFDMLGRTAAPTTVDAFDTFTPLDWTGSAPFEMLQAVVKVDGASVGYLKSMEFVPTINIQEDDYRAGGGGERQGMAVGAMDLDINLELAIEGSTQTALLQSNTVHTLEALFTQGANRTLSILAPEVTFQKTTETVENDMGIFCPLKAIASKDATAGTQLVFTTVNANAGTVYA